MSPQHSTSWLRQKCLVQDGCCDICSPGGFRPYDFSLENYKAADDTNQTQFSNLPDGFEAENVSDSSSSEWAMLNFLCLIHQSNFYLQCTKIIRGTDNIAFHYPFDLYLRSLTKLFFIYLNNLCSIYKHVCLNYLHHFYVHIFSLNYHLLSTAISTSITSARLISFVYLKYQ